ncbi:hypothetical protein GCM10027568_10830 [Humibacter soli]
MGFSRHTRRSHLAVLSAVVAPVLALGLAACSSAAPTPTSTAKPSVTSSAPAPVPSVVPTVNPKGSAKENLGYFDYVNRRTIAANPSPTGQQFVDGLAAAGFSKADMQVTADRTTVNLQPGSLQFSVLINGGCMIGQFGTDIGGYHSEVAPVLGTGKCLIGDTVPIQ